MVSGQLDRRLRASASKWDRANDPATSAFDSTQTAAARRPRRVMEHDAKGPALCAPLSLPAELSGQFDRIQGGAGIVSLCRAFRDREGQLMAVPDDAQLDFRLLLPSDPR